MSPKQDYTNLSFSLESNGVATIVFNRPEAKNSLSVEALQELYHAMGVCEDRADVHAIVLTGAGDAFCAGVNLKGYETGELDALKMGFREVAMWWHQALHRVIKIPKPVLAAVNGIAVGGGMGLAMAADIAVCNERARFYASWMNNGVANDGGSSYSLARVIGMRRAMEFMLTNRTLTAFEALDWGMVNRVYSNEDFEKNVRMIAADLAAGPTHLQGMVKSTFHEGWSASIEECTEQECANILVSLENPYASQRLEAFRRGERTNTVAVRLPESLKK